jgi:hypothetical protein
MNKVFRTIPFYCLLLPLFFVLHGFRENFGHIPAGDASLLALYYIAAVLVTAGAIYLFYRNILKTAFITAVLFCIYFFFGAIHDFLKDHAPAFMSRYRFLFGLFLVALSGVIVYCAYTKSKLTRITFFLNLLLVIYISVECFRLLLTTFDRGGNMEQPLALGNNSLKDCPSCVKPDIWFIVFDSYASSASLKSYFEFYNPLDSILLGKGFSIQRMSRSNYNLTPFSIASILNMSYVENFSEPAKPRAEDYLQCNMLIRKNIVTRFLAKQGYSIINYSVFDMEGNPTRVNKTFLPLKTNLITENTLYGRVARDMGEWLFLRFPFKFFFKSQFYEIEENNKELLELTVKESTVKKPGPRFVYTHVYLPHRPYLYDRHGGRKPDSTVLREFGGKQAPPYLEYTLYANTKALELFDAIRQNDPSAVIIFMGDHGHRIRRGKNSTDHYYSNMNAVYFADKDYRVLYDSISGVNQFRAVFNKLFAQSIPLLKDSVTFVKSKE